MISITWHSCGEPGQLLPTVMVDGKEPDNPLDWTNAIQRMLNEDSRLQAHLEERVARFMLDGLQQDNEVIDQ